MASITFCVNLKCTLTRFPLFTGKFNQSIFGQKDYPAVHQVSQSIEYISLESNVVIKQLMIFKYCPRIKFTLGDS